MKKLYQLGLIVCLMIVFSTTALGYLDPSIMTYAIQAIAGIVIAIGAGVSLYWRKAKRKLNQTFGINSNIKKEIESDVIEFDDDDHKGH